MHIKVIILSVVGLFLVVFGVISLALPFLPGFILIVVGFYLLSLNSVWCWRQVDKLKRQYPSFARIYDNIERVIRKFFRLQ